jgi:protein AATF/BFR2
LYGDSSSEEEDDEEINSENEEVQEKDVDNDENEEEIKEDNEIDDEEMDEDDIDKEEEDEEEEEEEEEEDNGLNNELKDEFAQLEKEQNEIVNNMSQSIKSDIEKGKQVKNQISLCDSLLDLRIRIQKAVNVANQLPQFDTFSYFNSKNEEAEKKVDEAKKETLDLINDLLEIRGDLTENNKELKKVVPNTNKRKRDINDDDLMNDLWEEINEYNNDFAKYQNNILEKWNRKVQTTTGIQKQFKAVNQSIVSQFEQLLADKERLIKRTQLKRSDYKSLGKQEVEKKEEEEHVDQHLANYDPEIFDDTDFYQQLLKELIESRMSETDDPIALSMKWATFKALQQKNKKKKVVDTKASKGRKIRYHVHEKIQNFMVPIEMGTWHEEMTNELFKSLFGRNTAKPEEEKEEEKIDLINADDGKLTTTDGLRIFG